MAGTTEHANLTFVNTLILNTHSHYAGILDIKEGYDQFITFINTTFRNNSGDTSLFDIDGSSLNLTNCTFENNYNPIFNIKKSVLYIDNVKIYQ